MRKRIIMPALVLLAVFSGTNAIAEGIKSDSAYIQELAANATLRELFWEKFAQSSQAVDDEDEADKAGELAYEEGWAQGEKDIHDPNNKDNTWSLGYAAGWTTADDKETKQYAAGYGNEAQWAQDAANARLYGNADGYSIGYLGTTYTGIVPLPDNINNRNLIYTEGELILSGFDGFTLHIFDMLGRSHTSHTITADTWSIHPKLSTGVHILRLHTSGEVVTFQLLVK